MKLKDLLSKAYNGNMIIDYLRWLYNIKYRKKHHYTLLGWAANKSVLITKVWPHA